MSSLSKYYSSHRGEAALSEKDEQHRKLMSDALIFALPLSLRTMSVQDIIDTHSWILSCCLSPF